MFTGIIEAVGTTKKITHKGKVSDLTISVEEPFTKELRIGDSIAINGTCLTVVSFDSSSFAVQMVEATRNTTSLGALREGVQVNLEKALAASGRFDGHFVQGHVDGVGSIAAIDKGRDDVTLTINVGQELSRYMISKGSVAIDGISLTIQRRQEGSITIAVIPHTYRETTLARKKVGDTVNIEADVLGKYVVSYLSAGKQDAASLTVKKLRENGF